MKIIYSFSQSSFNIGIFSPSFALNNCGASAPRKLNYHFERVCSLCSDYPSENQISALAQLVSSKVYLLMQSCRFVI